MNKNKLPQLNQIKMFQKVIKFAYLIQALLQSLRLETFYFSQIFLKTVTFFCYC